MNARLTQYLEAWRLRAESAMAAGAALDARTELAAAEQALSELVPVIPTQHDPICPMCDDD